MSAGAPFTVPPELPANRIAGLLEPPESPAAPAAEPPESEASASSAVDEEAGQPAAAEEAVDPERVAFERNFERGDWLVGWQELFLGCGALTAWFALFTGGTLIATKPYLDAFAGPLSFWTAVKCAVAIVAFWTISNVGVLSILAAMLGAFGQRTRFTAKMTTWHPAAADLPAARTSNREMLTHYASAIMRGFGVYALLLSGLLVMATEAIVSPDQSQYVRLAGTVSVISFYAGYDPEMLAGLLKRIERFLKTE